MDTINPSMTHTSNSLDMSLLFPKPPMDETSKVPIFPFRCVVNNPTARASLDYSIIDDFTYSSSAMSTLEVLRTCHLEQKAFISALGAIDPSNSRLITFDLDQ